MSARLMPKAFVACTLLAAGTAAAEHCALEPSSAARGQEVRLALETALVTEATIGVAGDGKSSPPVTIEVRNKAATFTVPRVPLGDYVVSAILAVAGNPAGPKIACPPL
ncbi:MAG: hypothetical protein ABUS56_12875, partial [Acidobacteriota bacterium]